MSIADDIKELQLDLARIDEALAKAKSSLESHDTRRQELQNNVDNLESQSTPIREKIAFFAKMHAEYQSKFNETIVDAFKTGPVTGAEIHSFATACGFEFSDDEEAEESLTEAESG